MKKQNIVNCPLFGGMLLILKGLVAPFLMLKSPIRNFYLAGVQEEVLLAPGLLIVVRDKVHCNSIVSKLAAFVSVE